MFHVDNSTGVPVMPQPSPVTSETELSLLKEVMAFLRRIPDRTGLMSFKASCSIFSRPLGLILTKWTTRRFWSLSKNCF